MGLKKIIQFQVSKTDDFYTAASADVPVVTQGKTLDELTSNINEAVELYVEGEDLSELGLENSVIIKLL